MRWSCVVLVVVAGLVTACSGGSPDSAPSVVTPTVTAGASSGSPAAQPGTPSIRVGRDLATGLSVPWGVAFLPDGSALVGERGGTVHRLTAAGEMSTVGRVADVSAVGEGGLLGLVASTSGDTVFAYFTSTRSDNRVVRMPYAEGRLGPPRVILDGIASAPNHNGGALVIGPEGDLWIGTGDARQEELAQRRGSLNGKILRITTSGKVPAGNPFRTPVWSLGHRNVEGLAFDSRNRLWATEFGENTWDELNLIQRGGNYGWPEHEGRSDDESLVDPQVQWRTDRASPSGIAIVDDVAYVGALRGARVWQVPLGASGAGEPVARLEDRFGRIRGLAAAPGGGLWLTTSNQDGRGDPRDGDDRVVALTLG